MWLEEELCMKFPAVLRDKLLKNEIELPDTAEVEYERIFVYRAVERKMDDHSEITSEDFWSYFELGKKPKVPRGMKKRLYQGSSLLWSVRFFEKRNRGAENEIS